MKIKKSLNSNIFLWISALVVAGIIKIFSLNQERVELDYSSKFYFFFSKMLRFLFGWIPFSLGDLLYLFIGIWLFWKLIKTIKSLFKRQLKGKIFFHKCLKYILAFIFIYIIFNIFWGLNYNRKGIASQLNLSETTYDTTDMLTLQNILLKKVNYSKLILINKKTVYPGEKELFDRAQNCYRQTQKVYRFLQYKNLSVKSSLYGWWGDYLGFTGYYNPFSGEAQINTTVPKFLQPYIATHEMAHQLGYAKEDEANFAGYLAAANSTDTLFHYSTYLDLFLYANREVYYFDSTSSKQSMDSLIGPVKKDIEEWRRFNQAHRSFIEPVISWMYGNYLKLNQQPKGIRSYNEVISMLIAYYNKFGKI
ncbi:MAG: DUF3810 domain-containing protein [Bacteroidota bacterium]|nr:DUF3810 domain-containing protein [Bacteroidota bacterium]